MVKVLFFIPNLAHGGAERVLVNLVNHMDTTKFDITVQTMFDTGIYRDKINKNIRYIGGFPWYFPGNTRVFKLFSPKTLFKHYVKEKYDVIVSYLEGPSARVIGGCDCKESTKLISWIHVEQEKKEYAHYVFKNEAEANACYQAFDRTYCVSRVVKEDFLSLFPDVKNVDVIYNTVETDVIKSRSEEEINDIVFSDKEINIISVAKLMKVKGYDRMVRILKRLRDDGIPAHVYIVGKGEELGNLEKLIKENGVEKYWSFVGFRENPYKYVKNADLYVCSSHREGFSTAVTEALIVGTPVVSTNCSGAKELLGDNNEYGIVTENDENALYEGIKEMLKTPENLKYYKKQAEVRGEKFNTSSTVEAVENMLIKVVKE